MAEITLTIDSKHFRMACEDGQEAHLMKLAAHVDSRIRTMRESFGEIGDLRLAVMAALMVADEFFEEQRKSEAIAAERAEEKRRSASLSQDEETRDVVIARSIDALAARIERIARVLSPNG